jgi:predicted DNA-binding transcriptional regulator AlpA
MLYYVDLAVRAACCYITYARMQTIWASRCLSLEDITMFDEHTLVDWKNLKKLGWPYSRAHTWRMIKEGRFPTPIKFGKHPGSRVAWRWKDVSGFFDGSHPSLAA